MRQGKALAVLVVLVLGFAAIAGATAMSAAGGDPPDIGDPPKPGIYTYQEARERGLVGPLLHDPAGLPPCSPKLIAEGAPKELSAAEMADLADDPPQCEADPTTGGTFAIIPSPSLGQPESPALMQYGGGWQEAYVGTYSSNYSYQGVRGDFEVTNPTVDHCSECPNGVIPYVKAVTAASNWTSIGWAELGVYNNNQYVWTFRSGDSLSYINTNYSFDPGDEAKVRVRHCGIPGQLAVCTELLWGNPTSVWISMVAGNSERLRCQNSNGSGNCRGAAWTLVGWGDDSPPGLDGPLTVRNIRIRTTSTTWSLLNSSSYSTGERKDDNPYCADVIEHSYKYLAKKAASC